MRTKSKGIFGFLFFLSITELRTGCEQSKHTGQHNILD